MTPHEHYEEAERIIKSVTGPRGRLMAEADQGALTAELVLAQVHATLALAPHDVRHDPYAYNGIPPWA